MYNLKKSRVLAYFQTRPIPFNNYVAVMIQNTLQ